MKPVVVSLLTLVLLTTLALAATAFVELLGKKRGRHVAVSRAHRRALLTIAVASLGSAAVALAALTGAESWGSALAQPAGAVLASGLLVVALRHVQHYVRMLMGIRSGGRKAARLRQRLALLRSVLVRPALVFGVFFAALAISGFTGDGVWPGRPPSDGGAGSEAGSAVDGGTLDASDTKLTSGGFTQTRGMRTPDAEAVGSSGSGQTAAARDGGSRSGADASTASGGASGTAASGGSAGSTTSGSDGSSGSGSQTPGPSDSPSEPVPTTSDPVKQVTQTVEKVIAPVKEVTTEPVKEVTDPVSGVTDSVDQVTDSVDQVTGDVTGTVGSLLP